MPEITPKSPELLLAQAAAYATERNVSDQRHENIRAREAIFSLLESVSRHDMDFQEAETTPLYTDHYDRYVNYLREIKGSGGEPIQRRVELSGAFEVFRPQVEEIIKIDRTTPYNDLPKHPAFLGAGESSKAYKLESGSKDYAVRLSRMMVETDSRVSADLVGKGIPHLEQLTAISYVDHVTVAEIIPGKSTASLSEEKINIITKEQLQVLFDTVVESFNQGVALDPSTNNFRYDPEAGFGIIDYHSQISPMSLMRKKAVSEAIRLSAIVIGSIGNRTYGDGLPDFYAADSQLEASKRVLLTYRAIVKGSDIPSKEKRLALAEIDKCVAEYNPERLADRQAYYERYYGPRK